MISAIKAGAHLIRPYHVSLDSWVRTRNLIGSYFISGAPQIKVAEAYKVSTSSTNQLIHRGLEYLWINSPHDIKECFPLSYITTSKKQVRQIEQKRISTRTLPPRSMPKRQRTTPLFEGHELHPALKQALEEVETPLIFANSKIREFLKAVIANGAHLKKPERLTEETWIERRSITAIYFSSVARYEKLGLIYNLSRERIRQIIGETLTDFHLALPDPVKDQFPLHEILSSQGKTKDRQYKALLEGKYNRLVELLEEGLDITQLADRLKLNEQLVKRRLLFLKGLGLKIPEFPRKGVDVKKLLAQLQDQSLHDAKVQQLLDQVTSSAYSVGTLGDNPILIPVVKVASEAGFHSIARNGPKFTQALKDAKIPLGILKREVKTGPQKGTLNYHFIASHHKERARQILLGDPNLKRFLENPVSQIRGIEAR